MNSIIVAYDKNRVIGLNGKIPWNLPSERDRMKKICSGKKIIMGRKSFEEIGHALSYCTIIIVSTTLKKAPQGCLLAHSLQEAVEFCNNGESKGCIFAGGEQIYKQALALNLVDIIYATEIQDNYEGNSFFPELPECFKKTDNTAENSNNFQLIKCENGIEYRYTTYIKQ